MSGQHPANGGDITEGNLQAIKMENKLTVCVSWAETPPSPWRAVAAQSRASGPPLPQRNNPVGSNTQRKH